MRSLSASGQQSVIKLGLVDGSGVVAKITGQVSGERLEREAEGLKALNVTGVLEVPAFHEPCIIDGLKILITHCSLAPITDSPN